MITPKFTCIGNACTDIIASVSEEFLEKHNLKKSGCIHLKTAYDLRAIKENMGKTIATPGGAGANTAHTLSALGANTSFIANNADDKEGQEFLKNITLAGVTPMITTCKAENHEKSLSTQVLGFITPDGDRSFASYDGIARHFSKQYIPQKHLQNTQILYIDGYTLCSEYLCHDYLDIINSIKHHGGQTCFNVGDRSYIEMKKESVCAILEKCDGFICNKSEAEALYGEGKSITDLATIMSNHLNFGAITDGANGAIVFRKKEHIFIPSKNISHIPNIDSIGAGDHFSAGFLYGLYNDFTLEQSGKLATLCALNCLSHTGGRPLGGKNSLIHLVEQIKNC